MRIDGARVPELTRQIAGLLGVNERAAEILGEPTPVGMTLTKMLGLTQAHLLIGVELDEKVEEGMPALIGV